MTYGEEWGIEIRKSIESRAIRLVSYQFSKFGTKIFMVVVMKNFVRFNKCKFSNMESKSSK